MAALQHLFMHTPQLYQTCLSARIVFILAIIHYNNGSTPHHTPPPLFKWIIGSRITGTQDLVFFLALFLQDFPDKAIAKRDQTAFSESFFYSFIVFSSTELVSKTSLWLPVQDNQADSEFDLALPTVTTGVLNKSLKSVELPLSLEAPGVALHLRELKINWYAS